MPPRQLTEGNANRDYQGEGRLPTLPPYQPPSPPPTEVATRRQCQSESSFSTRSVVTYENRAFDEHEGSDVVHSISLTVDRCHNAPANESTDDDEVTMIHF